MTATTLTIAEFLLARLAERRERAEQAKWAMQGEWFTTADDKVDEFVRDMSPARVLADVEAKRRIVMRLSAIPAGSPCSPLVDGILADLALPFAEHPDYRAEEWAP